MGKDGMKAAVSGLYTVQTGLQMSHSSSLHHNRSYTD